MSLLFPSEADQIESIEHKAESKAPSAFLISDSEINEMLRRGSGFEGGKLRIMALYAHEGNSKARADFLKKEYGIGGHSWDFTDGSRGFVDYRSQGFYIRSYGHDKELRLRWTDVEKRIGTLIQAGSYLSPEERARYAQLEREYAGYGGIPMPTAQHAFPKVPDATSAEPTPDEDDPFSDIDPEWVRKRLAEHGIVNGVVVDPEKLAQSPFIRQVEADVARIAAEKDAAEETPVVPEADNVAVASEDVPEGRFHVIEVDWYPGRVAYSIWDDQTDSYYEDKDGLTVDFISRWQAEEYRRELEDDDQQEARREAVPSDDVSGTEAGQTPDEVPGADATGDHLSPVQENGEIDVTERAAFPYAVGDTVYLEDGKPFVIDSIGTSDVHLLDPSLRFPVLRAESRENFLRLMER
ncbi:MAG: hypothetical protein LUH23_05620, partial [Oscillospiraceae bacterium]|nr:hypothetical protein [Oscillospiraceae bacterium]